MTTRQPQAIALFRWGPHQFELLEDLTWNSPDADLKAQLDRAVNGNEIAAEPSAGFPPMAIAREVQKWFPGADYQMLVEPRGTIHTPQDETIY